MNDAQKRRSKTMLEVDEVLMKLDGYTLVNNDYNFSTSTRICFYAYTAAGKFGHCSEPLSIFFSESSKNFAYICENHVKTIVNSTWSDEDRKRWVCMEKDDQKG